jgi:hypothetical protein
MEDLPTVVDPIMTIFTSFMLWVAAGLMWTARGFCASGDELLITQVIEGGFRGVPIGF